MKRQLGLSLVILAVLSVPQAWSQTGGDQSPSGSVDQSQGGSVDQSQNGSVDQSQNGSTDQSQQSSTGPQVAYTHAEQLPPLTMLNEVTANTGIRLSASTGAVVDQVSPGNSNPGYWQTLGTFLGGVHITQIRPTVEWDLRYNGGVSILSSGSFSTYTTLNQNAGANILWQFAKRWQLAVTDSYGYSNDPFSPYLTQDHVPTFNQPNPVIYIPQAVTELNVGSAAVTYEMTQRDSLSFTGNESFQRYLNTPLAANDSYSYSVGANYQHLFSPRFSAGGGYSFTALDFGHGLSRSGVQTISMFATYQLKPHMSVSGWVGPENTASKAIVPTFCFPGYGCFGYHAQYQSEWNVAEGATFSWTGTRDALHAGFRHQVSNGGGLLGAVRLYQVTAGYRRSLTSRWNLFAGFGYNNSVSILLTNADRFLNNLLATVGLSRNITQAWYASVYYSSIHQNQKYLLPQSSTVGTNGVGMTLRYTWGHSLGR
jgi:hypothetical protein